MIIINGKYCAAKVFTDTLEEKAQDQIKTLCDQEFANGSKIRIMPDVHAGAGCTIGTTMTISNKIVPNLVGVDIGCGLEVIQIAQKKVDLEKLDEFIHKNIPSGFHIRSTEHSFSSQVNIDQLYHEPNWTRAFHSIGTLGGGNHFIELNQDELGNLYLTVHSGSRHLGVEIANHYQNEGYSQLKKLKQNNHKNIKKLINSLQKDNKNDQIQNQINQIKSNSISNIPKDLAYIEGELLDHYIHDMHITQQYALWNRKAIVDDIVKAMNFDILDEFTTIHNYIEADTMILRKGAVSAKKEEKLIIPINMRDGSLICIGKGNPDWNNSAPHGAGRIMSRSAAKKNLNLFEFEKSMEGIYSTTVSEQTLDEAPFAYKSITEIEKNIFDTADIISQIKPIYNFKATT